jgi:hypothetical protein
MSQRSDATIESEQFWSGTYRGREIATFRHSRGWLVYLDRALQENKVFVTAEQAANWLRMRIDGREPGFRIWPAARRPRELAAVCAR